MLRLENLSAGYGRHTVLFGIDMEIPSASLVAVIGRNGSGKSTLLRTLAGLLPSLGGRVLYDGTELSAVPVRKKARIVSFVSTGRLRIAGMTCRELVSLGRAPYTDWKGRLSPDDEIAVSEALAVVGMEDFSDRKLDKMSDGECQMAGIARAIAQDTPVIILDEPTAFLDFTNRRKVARILKTLSSEGSRTVIWSTHDIETAVECPGFVLTVDGGKAFLTGALSSDIRDVAGRLFDE